MVIAKLEPEKIGLKEIPKTNKEKILRENISKYTDFIINNFGSFFKPPVTLNVVWCEANKDFINVLYENYFKLEGFANMWWLVYCPRENNTLKENEIALNLTQPIKDIFELHN